MKPTPIFVPAGSLTDAAIRDLGEAIEARTGLRLAPFRAPSPALLPELLERARDALAWMPPNVAASVSRLRLGSLLVALRMRGRRPRSAVLVARPELGGLAQLAGRKMGWVSRWSATGYELPRLYLESFGVEVDDLLSSQRFYGSHDAVARALCAGEVDVIATHSSRLRDLLARTPIRIVASVGPVPDDVVVAGSAVNVGVRNALTAAFYSLTSDHVAVLPVREGHLDLFDVLRNQASEGREPPPASPVSIVSFRGAATW